MTAPVIETPRGRVIQGPNLRAQLIWNPNFKPKHQKRYTAAQRFVDSEVGRRSEPYTPLLTSMLIKSEILGTDVGSGLVQWIAPYAKAQYYRRRAPGSQTGPLRGPLWFERMKIAHGKQIIGTARRLAATGEK